MRPEPTRWSNGHPLGCSCSHARTTRWAGCTKKVTGIHTYKGSHAPASTPWLRGWSPPRASPLHVRWRQISCVTPTRWRTDHLAAARSRPRPPRVRHRKGAPPASPDALGASDGGSHTPAAMPTASAARPSSPASSRSATSRSVCGNEARSKCAAPTPTQSAPRATLPTVATAAAAHVRDAATFASDAASPSAASACRHLVGSSPIATRSSTANGSTDAIAPDAAASSPTAEPNAERLSHDEGAPAAPASTS
mmetsp:Transcript_5361/g.21123  ORF Transcript_5361/g.21123 Transcript_5361/m.21123 type:complete len:252 (+) Transcript_5361:316-1071(+)